MKVVIIDYGAGNVQSVKFALERLAINAVLTADVEEVNNADKVIFPGVGEAGSAMMELQKTQLDQLIPNLKQPFLGICLGMQLMCRYSEEGKTEGLNIFPLDVLRFKTELKIPQIGWNTIEHTDSALFIDVPQNAHVYYVHSYYVPDSRFTIAKSNYELDFSGAIQKDNFYACQFHPEKSGTIGERILKNFIEL